MIRPEESEEEFQARFTTALGFEIDALLKVIEVRAALQPVELAQVANTFVHSMRRLEKVALLPYNLAWLSVVDIVHTNIGHSATIEALSQLDPFEDDLDVEVPRQRDVIADKKFMEFLHSESGRTKLKTGAVSFLRRTAGLQEPALLEAAQDLVLQCTVGIWGAMEAFVADFVRALINLEPGRALALLGDEDCRRRIGRTKWSLEQLIELGPDLSSKIGDLVLSENDLSDLVSMKAVLVPLFAKHPGLVRALEDGTVYFLGKSRHLIAHRAGRVDARFEHETAGRWKIGHSLQLSAVELRDFAKCAATVVEQVIDGYRATSSA